MIRIALLILVSSTLYSQEFKKFRAQFGFGEGSLDPTLNNANRGGLALIFFEPSYRTSDKISVGVRLEASGNLVYGSYSITSYGINGQFYFSKRNFRPFAGIGVGWFHPIMKSDIFYGYNSKLEESAIGVYPRVGFDYGHLIVLFEINITDTSAAIILPPYYVQLPPAKGYLNSNYLSLKIGISIGGGRKKKY